MKYLRLAIALPGATLIVSAGVATAADWRAVKHKSETKTADSQVAGLP